MFMKHKDLILNRYLKFVLANCMMHIFSGGSPLMQKQPESASPGKDIAARSPVQMLVMHITLPLRHYGMYVCNRHKLEN